MSDEAGLILAALAALEVKHYVFDFLLQRPYQYRNKGIYGHPGGILHAGLHAAGSIPAVLLLPNTVAAVAIILSAEFFIHYHIDWAKEQIQSRLKLDHTRSGYFFLLGADQMLHHLTYVGMVAFLAAV